MSILAWWYVCSDFEGIMPARYLRHGAQPEEVAAVRDMPQLQPFWAAGFSFSRGHFKVQVPYDGYQPMVFQVPVQRFRNVCPARVLSAND